MAEAQGEQLFSQFADEASLQKQQAKILGIFSSVKKGINELSGLGLDLKASKGIKQVDEATAKYQATLKETNKLITQNAQIQAKLDAANSTRAKSLNEQKIALAALNKEQTLRIKLAQSVANDKSSDINAGPSLNTLQLQYQKATAIIARFNQEQTVSPRGQGLIKYAADVKSDIAAMNQSLGNFKDNVGNYANSLSAGFERVAQEISKLKQEQVELQQQSAKDPAGFAQRGGEEQLKRNIAAQEQLNKVQLIGQNSQGTTTQTVKQLERAYQGLASTGNVSNEFLKQFAHFTADAKKDAAELKEEIKLLSSRTRGLDLVVGTISGIATAFEAAAGATALFGDKNEESEKVIRKLIAVQTVANSVRELGRIITERGTAANIAYTFVLKNMQLLFGAASTAAARFGAALKLTIVGLVITGIVLLVQQMNIFGDSAEEAAKKAEDLNKRLEDIYNTEKDLVELMSKDPGINNQILLLKQQLALQEATGASAASIYQTKKKIAESENNLAQQQLEDLGARAQAEDFLTGKQLDSLDAIEEAQKHYYDETKTNEEELNKLRRQRLKSTNSDEIKLYDEEIKKQENLVNISKKNYEDYTAIITNAADKEIALQQTIAAEAHRVAELKKKAALDLFKYQQQLIIDQNKAFATNDSGLSVKTRIQAAQTAAEAEIEILKRQNKEDLDNKDLNADQIKLINLRSADEIRKIQLDLSRDIIKIRIDGINKEKEMTEGSVQEFQQQQAELLKAKIDIQQKSFDEEQNKINDARELELQSAQKNFKAGITNATEYNLRKEQIDVDYQRRTLLHQIDLYQKQIDLQKSFGEDTTKLQADLDKARSELGDVDITVKITATDRSKEFKKTELEFVNELKDKYQELGKTIQDSFVSLIEGTYEKRKNQIQDQIDDIDKLKEAEVNAVNSSTDSAEKKAAKIANIEAVAAAKKEELARRQRQIDRQKAIFDRDAKIFDIVTTAIKDVGKIKAAASVAYGEVLVATGSEAKARQIQASILAQIIPTIASSAIAAATLLAQPIPKFATGVESSPETDAIIGEKGRELRVDNDGKMRLYEKPSLVHLAKGTRILSNRATEDILAASQENVANKFIISPQINNDNSRDIEILNELKHLNAKPSVIIVNQLGIESTSYYQYNMKR
ncbi:MAG TPA: hypothetical protein VLF89_03630 [Candidatus Saccharimonadales bacterium]|nr:hypothetical protein [Candidatus Saccharimonadales bacterium]